LVAVYHPIKDRFDLVRAVRCKQKKSFISHKIIQRNKLFSRIERGSIRLPWQEKSLEKDDADKIPNTRFHVIADEKFRYDIAIGEGFDDPDSEEEEEDNTTGSDQEIENLPDDEEGEGTSSVDAEMPMAARRSHPRMSQG
jgi:hypothetical protein